jgi:anti-sigma regulatory factor (Ser/Thr protein kinase)
MTHRVSLQMTNTTDQLTELIRAAEAFLQGHNLSERPRYVVNLVLEELLTNIIKYGYEDSEQHVIHVALDVGHEEILIEVVDDGREFNPLSVPPPRMDGMIEELENGGLGIHLVRKLSDSMEYSRNQNSNKLRIRIGLP